MDGWASQSEKSDARDGADGHLPDAKNLDVESRAQEVSVSIEKCRDYTRESGLVDRHLVYPARERLPLSYGRY